MNTLEAFALFGIAGCIGLGCAIGAAFLWWSVERAAARFRQWRGGRLTL